jgi:methionyl-tRNA synthetase
MKNKKQTNKKPQNTYTKSQKKTKKQKKPSSYFEKINRMDKHLARLTRGHRDSIQINKVRNEMGAIQSETARVKKKNLSY